MGSIARLWDKGLKRDWEVISSLPLLFQFIYCPLFMFLLFPFYHSYFAFTSSFATSVCECNVSLTRENIFIRYDIKALPDNQKYVMGLL